MHRALASTRLIALLTLIAGTAGAAMVATYTFEDNLANGGYDVGELVGQGHGSETTATMTDPSTSDVWEGTAINGVQIVPEPASQQKLAGSQVARLGGASGVGSAARDNVNNTGYLDGFGSFLINVGTLPTGIERILFHARTTGGDARLALGIQAAGGGYEVGLDPRAAFDNNTGKRTFANELLSAGVWYAVVFEWDDGDGNQGTPDEELRLWVNPPDASAATIANPDVELTGGAWLEYINQMEQVNLDNQGSFRLYLDNLTYGTTFVDVFQEQPPIPEPNSLLLLALGVTAACRRGRRG